jgi:DNA-binding transcriptional MerR regulator
LVTNTPEPGDTDVAGDAIPAADLTIEQLAAAVGMSVRNIRNHHTRGLLPAPTVRGRVGYYGAEHVARLGLIRELQADGFNLAAIKRLVDAASGSEGRIAELRAAMLAPFGGEVREVITVEDVAKRLNGLDPDVVEGLRSLKLLVPLEDGRFERSSPALVHAYDQVLALGASPRAAVALGEQLSKECDAIAGRFVDLYVHEVWQPFLAAGQPEDGWEAMIDTIRALRMLASEVVLAMFKLRMSACMEAAADTLLEDQVKRAQLLHAAETAASRPALGRIRPHPAAADGLPRASVG